MLLKTLDKASFIRIIISRNCDAKRTRGGIESASETAHMRREKDGGGREILRQRSPTELLAFCTASCVVCSREFIVLYLDRRYSFRRDFA